MKASGRNDDAPERRLVDHFARLEQELIDASTRRIHDFERRLELEWEALRQLHEDRLTARSGFDPKTRTAMAVLALTLLGLLGLASYFYFRLADRMSAVERAAYEAQERTRSETASLLRDARKLSAETQAELRANERMVNVLAAADVQRFPLFGRQAAPAAAGQALWSRSRGLVLDAARVPQPSSGEVHQVWLVTTRGAISLGFVVPDSHGRVSATFDTPPDLPGNVVDVLVTVEPAGGSAAPGRRVLAAVDP